jgi:hypothetical protein
VRLVATPVTVRGSRDRRLSGKAARYVERLALLQNVIAGARQLACQSLGGDDVVGPGLLALVETLGLGAKAPGEVRLLCPGAISVAVLDVAFALLLAVAGVHAVDAARIGRKVADVSKPIDPTGFEKNDGGERLANAGTLVNKPYCGRGLTRSCRRFSRTSICDCSVAITATLALIAKPTSAASGRLSFVSSVSRLI